MTIIPQELYDTNLLVQVVTNLKTAQTFLLDNFFPNIVESDTQYVSIDVDVGKRRMSPFVSPRQEGKLVEARHVQTNVFEPPYIKDKRAPDVMRPVRRQIGERIGGSLSAGERMMANITFEMEDQIDMLKRRQEWMAAQALMTGKLTVSGDGVPTSTIDFNRDAALTYVASGSSLWDADPSGKTSRATEDVRSWISLVLKKSGAAITDLVCTNSAYNAMLKDEGIKQAIFNSSIRQNSDANITMGPNAARGAVLQGIWGGLNIWLYNDWFVDENDVEQPMIPDGMVLAISRDMMGTRAYGAIKDPQFSYGALAYAPKMWFQEDPAQTLLMMQSAPLVIPSRVNACLAATVAKPIGG
ncbi:major capsid protein [Entomobacter blattae]|uniref:Phage major capsid protein E n=1 Tax=Entomobacter blattae TaxID=2762277 RepID=A0A7H1NUH6_9PROT|nr:major capsid protein [Entomobacter blattae]QNT79436.1 Phage major capsid protein E [Entomobacter blattae]